MTHNVDPFIVKIPAKFQEDPEVFNFFNYFVRWAHDMWVKSGGASDIISLPVNIATTAYTTEGSEIVIATAAITVTLESSPSDETKVVVKRETDAGTVTVAGTIDNSTNFEMLINHDSYTFIYSVSLGYWVVV